MGRPCRYYSLVPQCRLMIHSPSPRASNQAAAPRPLDYAPSVESGAPALGAATSAIGLYSDPNPVGQGAVGSSPSAPSAWSRSTQRRGKNGRKKDAKRGGEGGTAFVRACLCLKQIFGGEDFPARARNAIRVPREKSSVLNPGVHAHVVQIIVSWGFRLSRRSLTASPSWS